TASREDALTDLDTRVRTYLHPFAASEPALSATLAVLLGEPDVRRLFLDRVLAARPADPTVAETVRRLQAATDVEVVVEPFLANVGNLDLVLFSRKANAVLAIENKTGTQLGKLQLTKYRLALRDSDPH